MDLRLGLIILTIYCVTTVTPAKLPLTKSGNRCSTHCTESKNLLYQPGRTYIYNYIGTTQIHSADGNGQLIEVNAKARVSVIDNCELSLQLEVVELKGLEAEAAAKKELEDHSIGFSYQDGSVASVCPSPEDSTWAVNVKKAIISALQVSSFDPKSNGETVTEIDILGHCETEYQASPQVPSWSSKQIRKVKNLKNCHHRQASLFSLFPTKYSSGSVQNLPILANEHSCKIEVSKESIISRVTCTDSATLLPLSWTKSTSPGFNSMLSLTLEASIPSSSVKPIDSSKRQTLAFKHTLKDSWTSAKGDVNQVVALLKDLCSSVEDEVKSTVPARFAELVYHLRSLPPSSTSKLWSSISKGEICPSTSKLADLFTDALIMDGSEGSLKVIVELINEGSSSPLTVNYWLTLLAFASSSTEGSIKSLLPLIKNKSLPRQSVLGVSALVHNYCSSPDVDCASSPIVNEVTRTLASRLAYKCSVSSDTEDDAIVALKGLANIAPYLSTGEIRSILECSKSSNSLFVRVTATETLQSVSCLDAVAPTMMELFTATEYDAELRIAAYKNVISCPSASKIEAIITTLENEPSMQVGSYVVSHLSNLQESSDPLKSEIKLYLTGIKIPIKSFPQDIRKYSRYYELSQHFSKINLGAVVESDVIFDKSYIPRSIKVNLSLPIFGSSVNVAEIGFRQKGLESSLEGLLGPSGSLKNKNWREVLETLASTLLNENDPNAIEANRYRLARRSVQWPFKPVKLESLVKKATITPSPIEGSMYIKVDGKTIIYMSAADAKKDSTKSMFISRLENVVKSAKYDRAFSFMVMDSIHQLPGINGFPIKIDINSTAVMGYKQTGKTVYPSFASQLSVKIGFAARTSQPGLKWVTTINSAPALSAEIKYKNSIPVNVTLSIPKDTLTLFHYKSDLISIAADNSEKQIAAPKSRHHGGCTQSFPKYLGLELCGELTAPQPLFTLASPFIPFNGPINFDIHLRKTDKSMGGWTFYIEIPDKYEVADRVYGIGFLIPDSVAKSEYKMSLGITNKSSASNSLRNVRFLLLTPYKSVDASIASEYGDQIVHARGKLTLDGVKSYSAMMKLSNDQQGKDSVFEGEIFLGIDQLVGRTIQIKSKATIKEDSSITFIVTPKNGAAYLEGTMSLIQPRVDVSGDLRFISFRMSNSISREKSGLRNNFNLSYRKPTSSKEDKFSLSTSIKRSLSGSIHKYVAKMEGSASKWPKNSFLLTWESSYAPWELIENDFTIETGYKSSRGYSSKSKVTQISRFTGLTGDYSDVFARNTLVIDVAGVFYKANLMANGQLSTSLPRAKIDFTGGDRSATDKHKILIDFGAETKPLFRSTSSVVIRFGSVSVNFVDSISEKSQGRFIGNNELMISGSTFWTVAYNYSKGIDNKYDMARELDLSVKVPKYNIDFVQDGSFEMKKDEMMIKTIGSNRQSKLWSIESKISQTSQSMIKMDLHSLGLAEAEVTPFAPNRLGYLKLSRNGYTKLSRFASSPSSFAIDSELKSKSSLVYQLSGQYKSMDKWSTTIITKPVTLSVALNTQNGKFDVRVSKYQIHHITSFLNDKSTFTLTSETTHQSNSILSLKTDYHATRSLAIEFVSKPVELHSEAIFKSNDRFDFETTFNLKRYSKVFTVEGSRMKKNVKINLTGRGIFSVKGSIDSTENFKLDVDVNNQGTTGLEISYKPDLKSFALNGYYPVSGWEQSTLIQHTSEATTIFSNTQKASQRYLFVNGRLAGDVSVLEVKLGETESLYTEWSSPKGKGSFKVTSGQYSFNHDSSVSLEPKKLFFTSLTTKSSKPLIKINLESDLKKDFEMTISLNDDHSLELSLESSKAFNAGLKLTSKSYSLDHFTKINYAPSMDSLDLKTSTNSKGVDVATIKFQSTKRAPVTLEIYSLRVIGTFQVESSGGDKRYALKVVHPINLETEINNKPKASQFTVYSIYKHLNGKPIFEVDAKIQPKSQSTIDLNIDKVKGRLTYSHWSSVSLTFDNGSGFDHQTSINFDSKTSVVEVKSSSSKSGSVIVRIDGYFDVNERMTLKVVKGSWDGSIELNVASLTLTTALTNQAISLVHSSRSELIGNALTITSDTTKSSINLFSLDCRLSTDSKSEVKMSRPTWSSTTTFSPIDASYNLEFTLTRPSISSEYVAKVRYDTQSSSLKLNSNIQRKGFKSSIETELNSSAKSWFKYSSSSNGRVEWEVSPFGAIKNAKISIDWKPTQLIHDSEVKYDQNGLRVKSTSSRSTNSLYVVNGELGKINGLPGIEFSFISGLSSYRHSSSYAWSQESFNLQSKSIANRVTLWDIKGNFPLKGDQSLTTIDLDSPKVSGKVIFDPIDRSVKIDVLLKQSKRRVVLKTVYGSNILDSLTFDLAWDADRDMNAHLVLSHDGETNEVSRKDSLTIEYGSQVKVKLSSKIGLNFLVGPHDVSLALNLPNAPSRSVSFHHEMTSSKVDCAFRWYENDQVVHQLVHEITLGSGSVTLEIGTKSRNPTFDGLHLSFKHSQNAFSSITSELKIQPSSGSPYSIKLNTESSSSRKERSFIGKLWVKTPINQYRQQGITINLSWTPDGSQSNANLKLTRDSGDSASFASNYLLKASGGSFSLSFDGPLTGVYDGSKIKGQFDARSNKKSASFESEIVTVGSLNVILSEQRDKIEGQATLLSKTHRYVGSFGTNLQTLLGTTHEVSLTQNNLELFASKLTLDYGTPLLGQIVVTSKGSDKLRFSLNRFEVSSEETKFVADYTGPKGPMKASLNLQSAESLSQIELQVCPASQCYNLQAIDVINRWGRDLKIIYRNGVYSSVYAGSYFLKSDANEYVASGLVNLNGVPFGGEIFATPSKSIGKIILAQRIIEARVKSTDAKFVLDLMADAKRDPSSKVTVEADWINQSVPSKGIINLSYKLRFGSSSLYRPISVSFLFKKDPNDKQKPYDSRIVFDLGKSESQSLIIESYIENISSNNQTISLTVYQPGSSSKVNFAVKGHLGSTKSRSTAGINWSWIDDNLVNRRGSNLFTIDFNTKEMTYIAHGGFNEISSRVQYTSDDKSINLIGDMTINGVSKKGQLTSALEGNCRSVKVYSGNHLFRKIEACYEPFQSIRINSQRFDSESSAQTDLSLILSQRNGKVLKASLNLDPNYSKQFKSIQWPSQNLRAPRWKGFPSSYVVDEKIFVDIYDPISQSVTVETIEFISEMDQHTSPLRKFVGNYVPKPSFNIPKINFAFFFDNMIKKLGSMIQSCPIKDTISQTYSSFKNQVDDMAQIVVKSWHKIQASMTKWSNDLISSVSRSVKTTFSGPFVTMNRQLNQLAKLPCKMMKSLSIGVSNAYINLSNLMMSNPDIRSLVNIVTSLYREITIELGKGDYSSSIKSSVSSYDYLLSPAAWGASSRFTTWNPSKGIYEAEIVSPIGIGAVKSSIRSSQQSLSDLNDSLNGLKATLLSEMAPPFKSTAFLLGGQHFVTFDGKSFDINTVDCSYLLARDFVNGTFSVIVKYHGENKKSFLITLGDESVIEIIPTEKRVKLGKNNVELPVIQDSLTILRQHQSIVLQDSTTGLTFKCFLGHDLCSLTLSGWYFGRTKGLFGTYDYEPSNDYLLPNDKQATDANNFASGWEIEGSCANPSGTPIRRDEVRRSSKAYRLCDKIFSSEKSPLADGFSFVPPNFYFRMCLHQMASAKGQERPEKALCSVAGAYIESVRANGFELTMPSECLSCEAGQEFGSRSYVSPTSRQSRADVVFVIEERPCNTKLINDLPNLARSMNKELEESGLKDSRFGVIGFGGLARDAHGHTARGELLFQHQDIVMALKRMELAPANSYDANYTDALSAIVLASQYPFRKAASKNIVLLTCKPCDERSSRFDYNDIQHILLSEGVTLHIVSNQRFEAKHATSKIREIFGINSGSIQRASDIRATGISDEQVYLRKSITVPKDVCISLAHLSNGSFYPSPLAISLDHRMEKLWSLGLARRVASTAAPHLCQHCDCVPDNDLLHSKILCRPCRPLKPVY